MEAVKTEVWRNGTAQRLSDGTRTAEVHSVFVSGRDVFVEGQEGNARGVWLATLWRNGTAQRLSDGTRDAWADSVFVSGNDVFVVEAEKNARRVEVATLWRNGTAQRLSDGALNARAQSLQKNLNRINADLFLQSKNCHAIFFTVSTQPSTE